MKENSLVRLRRLILWVFSFYDYRHVSLAKIGQLSKAFHELVKQGSTLFDILPRKTRQNHVEDDEEFNRFVSGKVERHLNDFNIELFLRAKLLPKFLTECGQLRIKDLFVIFDSAAQTHYAAKAVRNCLKQSQHLCTSIRKLEFSHSPLADASEFDIVRLLLTQCKLTLN